MTTDSTAPQPDHRPSLSRRHALTGVTTVGLALPLLAACSGDDGGDTATDPASSGPSGSSTPSPSESESAGGSGGAEALVSTADVEVGGGVILADAGVVITQPTEGEFKGFSVTCTHQGCAVSAIADGAIDCDCHGSRFSIEDGSVEQGPATSPLESVAITVSGDSITLA